MGLVNDALVREVSICRKLLGLSSREEVAFYASFNLSPGEARVLGALYRANSPLSTSRLAKGGAHDSVKVHVSRLRAKLETDAILGDPKSGYTLSELGRRLCVEADEEMFD
jgi:DNA-binding response OmpR family regulator